MKQQLVILAALSLAVSSVLVVAPAATTTPDRTAMTGQAVSQPKPEKSAERSKEDIMKVQRALKQGNYYQGAIDGILGPATQKAIKEFQQVSGLPATGQLDDETFKRILELLPEEPNREPTDRS